MRTTTRALTATMLAVAVIGCADDDTRSDRDQAQIEQLETELTEANAAADELGRELEALQTDYAQLEAELRERDAPDADEPLDPDAPRPQPERSAEGLVDQIRLLLDRGDAPDEFEPDTTPWQPVEALEGLADDYDSPGSLAFDLAATLDRDALGHDLWETTTRVLLDDDDPDLAYVAVLSWGLADDAVAGTDLRMTITRGDDGWQPGGAERRSHCRRGVSDDLCL